MTFQASDLKGCQFLDLYDKDNNPLELSYAKRGTWLKYFGHSNSLCTRVTRVITNHAPIGEYRLRFFSWEDFRCPCSNYPIETRQHILYECRRYSIGIQGETQLTILFSFWSLTIVLSLLKVPSLSPHRVSLYM